MQDSRRLAMNGRFVLTMLIAIAAASLVVAIPAPTAAAEDATTILFVRHADRLGEDDALTEEGKARAKVLGDLAKTMRVTAIYSTETNRTQNTAKPAAVLLDLEITPYNFVPGRPDPNWFQELLARHQGDTVLIVGHSNTLNGLIQGFGGTGTYPIEHSEYDRMFAVTVQDGKAEVAALRFGAKASGHED